MKNDPLYEETIPVFIHFLLNLDAILVKGSSFASKQKSKVFEKTLIEGRLTPDMYNFKEQIGYVYFMALEVAANLSGKKGPEMGYDEGNIRELRTSVKRVIAYLKTIRRKDFAHSKGKRMKTFLLEKKTISRERYVRELAVPNFFFHATTAYDIFRHKGIPLRKQDYLGHR